VHSRFNLAALAQAPAATFPLGAPGQAALVDMIRKPAEYAHIEIEDALADKILGDAGNDPGSLPLVAFCLEALYRQNAPEHRLTEEAYRTFGGMRGAIGQRATDLLHELSGQDGNDLASALSHLFRSLVHVDAVGTPTRKRAVLHELISFSNMMSKLVETLVSRRLLTADDSAGHSFFSRRRRIACSLSRRPPLRARM
jgi:hypothetical protein